MESILMIKKPAYPCENKVPCRIYVITNKSLNVGREKQFF
jgi:hypothetical protein